MRRPALTILAIAMPAGIAAAQAPVGTAVLPTSTEIPVVLVQEVNSRQMKVGQSFDVTVARDVWVGGRIAVPQGTHGRGAVVWRTGKGAFGKSGKMEIEARSIDLDGVVVPLSGRIREEGQGNTGATIGVIVAAGLVGGAFVTGHSAVFEKGRELRAFTTVPVAIPGRSPRTDRPMLAAASAPAQVARFVSTPSWSTAPAPIPVSWEGDAYRQKLAAQQGVRGRSAEGWTIGD